MDIHDSYHCSSLSRSFFFLFFFCEEEGCGKIKKNKKKIIMHAQVGISTFLVHGRTQHLKMYGVRGTR
jgi:hypothetical protein